MPFYNEVVGQHMAGGTVGAALLTFFDFASSPVRLWAGFGDLVAGGHTWQGGGQLIQIEGLAASTGTVAAATTFTLTGVDADFVARARNASHEAKGRRVQVFLQCLNVHPQDTSTMPWSTLDDPIVIWSGIMDQVQYTADGPGTRTITLTAESIWTGRNRPPYGLLSSADQKARYPGDKGLDRTASLVQKTIAWPSY